MTAEQTLAQRVRAKFPGAYDDLNDQQLEAAIVAKFPGVYDDIPKTQAPQAAAPAPPRDPMRDAMRGPIADTQKGAADPVTGGFAKGLVKGVVGLADLAHRYVPGVAAASDAVQRAAFGDVVPAQQLFDGARADLQPQGTAEKIGMGIEQTAEFFVPGGPVRRGAQAVAAAAPKLARAARAGAEALSATGVSTVQGGDPTSAGLVAGAVSAIVPGGNAAASLRKGAENKVMQALGPTKERYKAMAQRLTPEILRRGLGGSREGLAATAAETAETVGSQIDDAIQQFGARGVDTAPIVSALESAKDAFRAFRAIPMAEAVRTGANRSAGARIAGDMVEVPVVFEPRAIRQLEGLQGVIAQLGPNPRVDQLIAVRRAWDKVVDQAGGFSHRAGGAIGVPLKDQSEAWAKREASGAIRKLLADEVPELAALNKEFAFWKGLEDVLTQTLKRTAPQSKGLLNAVSKGAGQAVGSVAGSPAGPVSAIGGAAIGGKVASTLEAMFTSPRWRLVDAKLRVALADALSSGYRPRIEHAIARITAAMAGGTTLRPATAR